MSSRVYHGNVPDLAFRLFFPWQVDDIKEETKKERNKNNNINNNDINNSDNKAYSTST